MDNRYWVAAERAVCVNDAPPDTPVVAVVQVERKNPAMPSEPAPVFLAPEPAPPVPATNAQPVDADVTDGLVARFVLVVTLTETAP